MGEKNIYKVVIDSMAAHVAILDERGTILETNLAWQEFGRDNGIVDAYDSVGINYLSICETSSIKSDSEGLRIANGIRKVLSGELGEFFMEYPCHSPDKKRWFAARVVPYRDRSNNRVIVTHEDITKIMVVQEELQIKEEELLREREHLEEANIALRVLLRQREDDQKRIEKTIYTNIDRLVLPYLGKVLHGRLTDKQRSLLDLVNTNLRDIISPFLNSLSSLTLMLTPQEIEVAHMVRSGKTSKEIAEVLGLSVSGVDFHRKRLRRKLGLANSAKNLRSYLMSLK